MKPANLIGHKYGRLTVIERAGTWTAASGRKGCAQWLCRCECGQMGTYRTSKLRDGSTLSCGCLRRESSARPRTPQGHAGFTTLYIGYMGQAKNRNIDFGLTKEEFRKYTKGNCHYCNQPPTAKRLPQSRKENSTAHGAYVYNGVDRIDSKRGYSIGNCITACKRCNVAKSDMTYDEFIELIKAIYNNRVSQNK